MVHGQRLVNVAYLACQDPSMAQDAVQTVFMRLMKRDSRDLHAPMAYLRRAVINEVISQQRKAARRTHWLANRASSEELGEVSSSQIDRMDMFKRLEQLTPRQRAAIVLRYYEDLDDVTAAEVLNCAPATVRSLVRRGLASLRQTFEGDTER